ncbi:hypothetical protein D3P07_00830 [Paenibacillus sp. 1011MAR3C5]|uniref:S-layer homology domain-containing protein n=1 Tax=Paenibacillus sp. 1011MAR3C5 TaxID=1675787 RepID=UPI000E6B5EFE|nr:S-layer homology domain-containing protein [Paenibacillus sp. 1011MAR3C5]RJE90685.1 hypothetical protein D3P07_00830 [Paenibacillus sp. 1011MAR3C5]
MLMLHKRKPISLLLAIVMLLSTLAAGPMVPFGGDDTVWAAQGPEPAGEFVRIKNKWTGHYLYEDESGIVRYGFTSATDANSHWAIEEGINGSGSKSIRNRASGQYISVADIAGRTSALTTASTADGGETAWIVEPAVNRAGQFTIRSEKFTGGTYFIHEEDQLGYAQVSGDIGAEWESPQWSFETAPTEQAVRIYNKSQQAYLYEVTEEGEDKGKIAYGDIAYHDAASHWYVHEVADNGDGGATVELRNALTNHVITQGTHWAAIAGKTWDASSKNQWVMSPVSNTGYVTFTNVYAAETGEDSPEEIPQGTYVLNTQFDDIFVRSNNWSNAGNDNAQWRIEVAPAVQPVRLVNYRDIGDENSKIYLFEDQGLVRYGTLEADSAAYQWIIEDYNGSKRVRNLQSGLYISPENIGAAEDPLEVLADEGGAGQWRLNESPLYDNFVSLESVIRSGHYIHVGDAMGFAQSGEVDPAGSDAQWYVEDPAASAGGDPQIVQIRNVWQNMYLYEDGNGVLKYGNARPGDQRAEWIVTRYNGRSLIQNRETGHYLNVLNQTTGHLPLSALDIETLTDEQLLGVLWRIKDNGGGKNIWSAQDLNNDSGEQAYINLQNLTKYAEYSAINPNWGSPKWQFVAVADDAVSYVRIKNNTTGDYWYEDHGVVKYGDPADTDFLSHWLVEESDGGRKVIRNRATGHYVSMQPSGSDESEIENADMAVRVIEVDAAWSSHKWIVEENGELQAFKNGWTNDHYLTNQDGLGHLQRIRSAQLTSPEAEDSKWFAFENAPNMSPYVRIKSKSASGYWYEQDKELRYGDLDASDSRTHWFMEDAGDGAQYVRNRATGHYINIEFMDRDNPASAISVEHFEMEWGSASPKWMIEDAATAGYVQFNNVWNPWRFLSTKDELGHVQQVENPQPGDDDIQFVMEGVPADQLLLPANYIRIKNAANGQYLLQSDKNVVVYGEPAADNAYSHWLLESGDGTQRIKNRATGMYLSLTPDYKYAEATASGVIAGNSQWIVEGAPIGDDFMLRSLMPGYSDEYLNTASSLGYPERGLHLISSPSLHWTFETAPAEAVTPEWPEEPQLNAATAIFDDSNYVRLINKATGELLLERGGKAIPAKAAASVDDPQAHWLIQDYNGHKLFKNRASGRLLMVSSVGSEVTTSVGGSSPIGLGAQWNIREILGYEEIVSVLLSGQQLRQNGETVQYGTPGDDASRWTLDPVAGTVRYEAEKAFVSGGVAVTSGAAGAAGYASGFSKTGARTIMAVNGQEDGEYKAAIRYSNPSVTAQTLTLKVNGLDAGQLQLAPTGSGVWRELSVTLPLREGYNSVSLERTAADTGTGQALVDAVVVQDNVNLDYRGATLPYTTYEAEHMATNGSLLGPSRVYLDVASEASGRQAVRLSETGHYVEFEAAKDADSIVVRYSIPDAPTGGGIEATIGVYVDGQLRAELDLNSAYAWVYGNYPWSNDPKQGSAHRFYDDARAIIGQIPAGSIVRLEVRESDAAEYYIIDLVDLEQAGPALEMPEGFLSIAEFGAVADDGLDDTEAFKAAMEAAKSAGKGVWVPEGTFEVGDGLLILDNVTIRGAGKWHTILNGAKFFGNGSNIGVFDLFIDGKISVRDDIAQTNGFEGAFGPGSTVQNVWIEHTKTGLWLTRPINKGGYTFNTDLYTDEFYIAGSRIRNVMADGMNFAVNTKNSMAEHMNIRYPGDDGMAMWSFVENVPTDYTENNTYRFNTVQLPWLANNIIVFGGKNHKVQDNIVLDTVTHGSGISVSTKFTPTPYEGTFVVERNTLIRTGSNDPGAGYSTGAIWIYAYDRDIDSEVIIRHNTALDSTYHGLSIGGAKTLGSVSSERAKVTVEDMVIDGAGLTGIEVGSTVKGAINFKNVIIRHTKFGTINNAAGDAFRIHRLSDRPEGPGQGSGTGGPTELPGSSADNDRRLSEGAAGKLPVIELSVDSQGVAELSIAALRAAAVQNPDASVVAKSGRASYVLPVDFMRLIAPYVKEGGTEADGTLILKMEGVTAQLRDEIASQARAAGLELAGEPVQFRLYLKRGDSLQELNGFGRTYMTRTITVDGRLNPATSAAMIYDPGTREFRYVPALFSSEDESTTATIMSPGNSIYVVVQGAKTFADMEGHWARASIEQLSSKRIVFGKSEDRFAPQDAITRAEFAALLVRALGLRAGIGGSADFSDVKASDWFYREVSIAAELGLISGFGDGSFRPNDTITREQMAVMAANALGAGGAADGAADKFGDRDRIGVWARNAVEYVVKRGIMQGKTEVVFAPNDRATRAEAVVVLKRVLLEMKLMDE